MTTVYGASISDDWQTTGRIYGGQPLMTTMVLSERSDARVAIRRSTMRAGASERLRRDDAGLRNWKR
jgi:hypothetical protein